MARPWATHHGESPTCYVTSIGSEWGARTTLFVCSPSRSGPARLRDLPGVRLFPSIDSATGAGYTEAMQENEVQLTLEELAERVNLGMRTIRFYISEGLLPGPGARGKAATYDAAHVSRLGLIRRLVEQRVPLKVIRERIAHLTDAEIGDLIAEDIRNEASLRQASVSASPKDYISSLLERARAMNSRSGPAPQVLGQGQVDSSMAAPTRGTRDRSRQQSWQRWEVAPGIELHVRGDVAKGQRGLIERLLALAESAIQDRPQ
jgi:DNA-binding transcriptional MerR regulator